MVRPAYRSRSLRRVKTRTPGGRLVVCYEKRFSSPPRCAISGAVLQGMNVKRAKTDHTPIKPPSRPYGGYVAHFVLARALRIATRRAG